MRQTKTDVDDVDNSEESSVDDLWNVVGNTVLSEKRIGFTSFRILNKRPPHGYSWDDGRLTKAQVTSRPERFVQMCGHPCPTCAQKKAKQQWDVQKPEHTSCTSQGENLRYSSQRKWNKLTPSFRTPESSWRFQWNQQCHALHVHASPPPRHRCRKLQCHKVGGRETLST